MTNSRHWSHVQANFWLQNIIVISMEGINLAKNSPHDLYLPIQEKIAPPCTSPYLAQNLFKIGYGHLFSRSFCHAELVFAISVPYRKTTSQSSFSKLLWQSFFFGTMENSITERTQNTTNPTEPTQHERKCCDNHRDHTLACGVGIRISSSQMNHQYILRRL
jgi:hypothetical protein